MRTKRGFLRAVAVVAGAALAVVDLAGCGGGSSSRGVYKGTEAPAEITVSGADLLTFAVVSDFGFNLVSLAHFAKVEAAGAPGPAGVPALALVHREVRRLAKAGDGARRSVKFQQTCPGGGHVSFEVPSLSAQIGTFKETFHQCNFGGGFVIDGPVTDHVATVTATREVGDARLNLHVVLGGDAFRFRGSTGYDLDSAALRNRTTGEFEYWDSANDFGFRLRDLDATVRFASAIDWNDDCALTEDYTVTVFESLFGMVEMATTNPVTYTGNQCTNPGPSSGGPIVLTGDGGGTITMTPFSTTQASFAVDVEGDAVPERTTTELWADLGFF